jgi:uncharacterized membrane protein YcjF (UPF0283 family)
MNRSSKSGLLAWSELIMAALSLLVLICAAVVQLTTGNFMSNEPIMWVSVLICLVITVLVCARRISEIRYLRYLLERVKQSSPPGEPRVSLQDRIQHDRALEIALELLLGAIMLLVCSTLAIFFGGCLK